MEVLVDVGIEVLISTVAIILEGDRWVVNLYWVTEIKVILAVVKVVEKIIIFKESITVEILVAVVIVKKNQAIRIFFEIDDYDIKEVLYILRNYKVCENFKLVLYYGVFIDNFNNVIENLSDYFVKKTKQIEVGIIVDYL